MTRDNELPVPFFSGLCLEGEVAGQYELEAIDGLGDEPVNRGPATAGSTPELWLEGLGPITIFVGANNSGKSRLMRELFSREKYSKCKLHLSSHKEENCDLPALLASWGRTLADAPIDELSFIDWIAESSISLLEFDYDSARLLIQDRRHDPRKEVFGETIRQIDSLQLNDTLKNYTHLPRFYVPMLRGMRHPMSPHVLEQTTLSPENHDLYAKRTSYDYFETMQGLEWSNRIDSKLAKIFSGLTMYEDLRTRLLGRTQELRQTVRDYEDFLSRQFFGGESVTLTPVDVAESGNRNDVVHIKIGDKADYPIHELGDGMQSLIICTYPIVTETRRGCLFFLEEPDLCMHPSLQRTFLEVLKHYHRSMGHQFFLTTHSNHLLDLVDDPDLVSVLSFSEISGNNSTTSNTHEPEDSDQQASAPAKFRIRMANRQDRDLLNQLGVRPSATFLANATIWVEGISDVAYLRVYMEAFLHYLKHWGGEDWKATASQLSAYKEDNHYAYVEYSGANLTHLIFTTADQDVGDVAKPNGQQASTAVGSLCGHAIVIADGDITDNCKGKRAEAFLAQLGERLIILPGKEVENLIPEDYAKKQVDDDHNGKGRCGIVSPESIDKISYSEYRQWRANGKLTGLGDYLNHLEIEKYRPSKSSGSQGTLPATYKQRWRSNSEGIPRKIREALQGEARHKDANFEDTSKAPPSLPDYMTRDLIWLCTCIYSHIAQCNHHEEVHRQLRGLRERMLHSIDSNSGFLPRKCGETADAMLDAWPSHLPDVRDCVLQSYATKSPLAT